MDHKERVRSAHISSAERETGMIEQQIAVVQRAVRQAAKAVGEEKIKSSEFFGLNRWRFSKGAKEAA